MKSTIICISFGQSACMMTHCSLDWQRFRELQNHQTPWSKQCICVFKHSTNSSCFGRVFVRSFVFCHRTVDGFDVGNVVCCLHYPQMASSLISHSSGFGAVRVCVFDACMINHTRFVCIVRYMRMTKLIPLRMFSNACMSRVQQRQTHHISTRCCHYA